MSKSRSAWTAGDPDCAGPGECFGCLHFDITIGRKLQPRAPKWGDGYDLWHIISASTADAFVTYDGRLVELLNRLPIEGFSIFPSIRALLKAITPHKPPTRALNVQIKVSLHVNQDPAPNK